MFDDEIQMVGVPDGVEFGCGLCGRLGTEQAGLVLDGGLHVGGAGEGGRGEKTRDREQGEGGAHHGVGSWEAAAVGMWGGECSRTHGRFLSYIMTVAGLSEKGEAATAIRASGWRKPPDASRGR